MHEQHRQNSYNKLYEYFKEITTKSNLIKGFAGYFDRDLRMKTNGAKKFESPFLALWEYNKGYLGESQNTKAIISLGYVIMKNKVSTGDFEEQYKAVDECEHLAKHINSRLRYDSNSKTHFLFGSYLKDRTQIEPIDMSELGFGVQVTVFFENPELLKLNPDDWDDIDSVC